MVKKIISILLVIALFFGIYFLNINIKEKHILNKKSQSIAEKTALELRGIEPETIEFKQMIKPQVLKELTGFTGKKNIYFEDEKSCKPIENEIVVCLIISKNENQRILNVTIWKDQKQGKGVKEIERAGSFMYKEK